MVKRTVTLLALALSPCRAALAAEPAAPAASGASPASEGAPAEPAKTTPVAGMDSTTAPPESPAKTAAHGELHHAPVSFAVAGEAIRVRATIDHPELVRRAILVYRAPGGEPVEVELARAPEGPYAAVIPAEKVRTPSLEYALELEDLQGQRRAAFASRAVMYPIEVADERIDERERVALARVGGRRTVLSASGDYVSFGESRVQLVDPNTGVAQDRSVSDAYYRIDAGFTYRLLRVVSDFGLRGGIVRGTSPVPGVHTSDADFNVGLNYVAPWARFRVHDLLHLDAQLLSSLTETGFSTGGGGAVHIGDVYGSHLELGFESIKVFGSRFYSQVHVATRSPVRVSAIVEATDTPHASRYGVRLLGELGADLGSGFGAAVRGGYQARDSASGGVSLGTTVSYAF